LQDTLHYFVCQFVIVCVLHSVSAVEIYRVVWGNKLYRSIVAVTRETSFNFDNTCILHSL